MKGMKMKINKNEDPSGLILLLNPSSSTFPSSSPSPGKVGGF